MSEMVGAALGAVEQALAPEVEAALKDAHAAVTAEADRVREALPGLVQAAVQHVSSVAEELLNGYHNVLAHLETKLGVGTAPAPAPVSEPAPAAPVAVDPTPAPSTTEAPSAPSNETPSASSTTSAESAPAAPTA